MFLTFCGVNYPPYMFVSKEDGSITGIFADLLQQVSRSLNFTYVFVDVTGKHYEIKDNNTFIEMFVNVQKGICDMLWSPVGVSYDLSQIVDYSVPLYESRIIILSAGPKGAIAAPTWNVISANPTVLGILFLVMTLLALLTFIMERKIWNDTTLKTKLYNQLWYYFGSLFLEPFPFKPEKVSTRLVIGVWWIGVVILVSLIGGNLKASLAIANKGTIDNLQDVIARPNLQTILLVGLAYEGIMRNSKLPVIAAAYQQCLRTGGLLQWPEIIHPDQVNRMRDGNAIMVFPDISAIFLLNDYCEGAGHVFHISEEEVFTLSFSVLQTKGLPKQFREKLNQKLRYFAATQQVIPSKRWQDYHFSKCMWRPTGHQTGSDIVFISTIWIIGMSISVVVLLFEMVVHRCSSKNSPTA